MGVNDPTDNDDGGQAPPQQQQQQGDPNERIRRLEKELHDVRREAAGYRTGQRGLLPQQLAAKDAEIRDLKVRVGLSDGFHRHAVKNHGVARAYLIDNGAMSRFDPSATDFNEVVDDAITELLETNPELRGGAGGASRSGPPQASNHWAPGGESPAYTREEIAVMPAEQVVALRRAGKLGHLTGEKR